MNKRSGGGQRERCFRKNLAKTSASRIAKFENRRQKLGYTLLPKNSGIYETEGRQIVVSTEYSTESSG